MFFSLIWMPLIILGTSVHSIVSTGARAGTVVGIFYYMHPWYCWKDSDEIWRYKLSLIWSISFTLSHLCWIVFSRSISVSIFIVFIWISLTMGLSLICLSRFCVNFSYYGNFSHLFILWVVWYNFRNVRWRFHSIRILRRRTSSSTLRYVCQN